MKQIVFIFLLLIFSTGNYAMCIFSDTTTTDTLLKTPIDEREYMAGDNELFFMPTAYTMPRGMAYVSDYELFFLNFGVAPGNGTQLGGFMLFPVSEGFARTFTFGAKQRVVNTKNISASLFGTYTFENSLFTLGGVVSLGPEKINVHIGMMLMGSTYQQEMSHPVLLLGGKLKLGKAASIIAEYVSFASFREDTFNGILTIGIRVAGQYLSGELAMIRPLMHNIGGDFISLPFVKVSYFF